MSLLPAERIEKSILLLRGHKVMLDEDLASLYGVDTRTLNQAVSRNVERFPNDFMFRLTASEFGQLKAAGGARWGGRRKAPYAFTEQGVAMLSSVLRSKRAIQVNIEIMRAFTRLRHILTTHEELARKLKKLEAKYDKQFAAVFEALRQLMELDDEGPKGRMGFHRAK